MVLTLDASVKALVNARDATYGPDRVTRNTQHAHTKPKNVLKQAKYLLIFVFLGGRGGDRETHVFG